MGSKLENEWLAKKLGMKFAADKRREVLNLAQTFAQGLGDGGIPITIDDVQRLILDSGENLGNAAGSVFRGSEWECVGFRPSTRPGNHGRIVRVWRFK